MRERVRQREREREKETKGECVRGIVRVNVCVIREMESKKSVCLCVYVSTRERV